MDSFWIYLMLSEKTKPIYLLIGGISAVLAYLLIRKIREYPNLWTYYITSMLALGGGSLAIWFNKSFENEFAHFNSIALLVGIGCCILGFIDLMLYVKYKIDEIIREKENK